MTLVEAQQKSESKIEALLRWRSLERRVVAINCAQKALSSLREEGVEAAVIGSLAAGNFMLHSDVDYLVCGDVSIERRGSIEAAIGRAMSSSGIGYDIVYSEDIKLEYMEDFCRAKLNASDLSYLAQEAGKS